MKIILLVVCTMVKKNRNLSIINKIHLKCDCIDGSVLNSVRQPMFYSFVLDKLPGFKNCFRTRNKTLQKNKQICFEYKSIPFRR